LASPDQLPPRLQLQSVSTGYGAKQVVFDVDLVVRPAQITVLLGHNGAGKTTTVAAAFGLLPATSGSILFDGLPIERTTTRARVRSGIGYVPSERFVFPTLTVDENLNLGGFTERDPAARRDRRAWVLDRWPILGERRNQLAGTMSGGQRRMLSLGIALMSSPSLLLLDEPSLGLAPVVVDQLFADLRSLADTDGLAVLLVEQSVSKALAVADDAYVMRSGRIIAEERASSLAGRQSLWDLF
jgi:branched-chain amino acid transport system ATP-binding protein